MTRRLASVAAALVVTAPVLVMLSSHPAGANFEFSFTSHQTNIEFVIGGHATVNPTSQPGPGDQAILRDDLLQGGNVVGYDNSICTITFNDNVLCTGVFAFTNKGDVSITTLIRNELVGNGPSVFDVAITGGTFAYGNAHGDGHAVNTSATDTNWTFNFVTQ
jgi:hypothetical protein